MRAIILRRLRARTRTLKGGSCSTWAAARCVHEARTRRRTHFRRPPTPHSPLCTRAAPQGMLSIGCALLGASHVIGLELDADALEVAQDNVQQFEDPLPVSGPTRAS